MLAAYHIAKTVFFGSLAFLAVLYVAYGLMFGLALAFQRPRRGEG